VGTKAARVNDPFRDTLMIEVEELLTKVEVFQRGGTRAPIFSEFWSSATGTPCCVVKTGILPPAVWCTSPPVPTATF
jgi:hypothetical protein